MEEYEVKTDISFQIKYWIFYFQIFLFMGVQDGFKKHMLMLSIYHFETIAVIFTIPQYKR
jgi:hypothetical protein